MWQSPHSAITRSKSMGENVLTAKTIARVVEFVLRVHDKQATRPHKRIRFIDGKTPYGIHPLWCAFSILAEERLTEEVRVLGFWVLSGHDVLEDTTAKPLKNCPRHAKRLIKEMTFSGIREEMRDVWERSTLTRLFKLFDKTSNLMDGSWMPPDRHAKYVEYTLRLAEDVERNFGSLNIVAIARAVSSMPYEFRESPWNIKKKERAAKKAGNTTE